MCKSIVVDKEAYRQKYEEYSNKLSEENNLQNVFTPFRLCNEMIGKLKKYRRKFEGKTFAVFNLEFAEVLMYDYGVDGSQITFFTDCPEKVRFAKLTRYEGLNVELVEFGEFLKEKVSMKFDVVIMNPPYQRPKLRKTDAVKGVCGSTLWDKFIVKALSLCKENGHFCAITPGQWRKPEHKLFKLLKNKSVKWLEIHGMSDGLKTFGVQTGYDWYIVQNSQSEDKTTVVDQDGKQSKIDIYSMPFVPNSMIKKVMGLVAKEGEETVELIYSASLYDHRKTWMSKVKTQTEVHPCVYGITKKDGVKLVYSSKKEDHFGVKKIVMPVSKSTYAEIDIKGQYGLCPFSFGVKVKSFEQAQRIKSALLSKAMDDVFKSTEWVYNTKNFKVLKYFRKDFWKEFVDEDGNEI